MSVDVEELWEDEAGAVSHWGLYAVRDRDGSVSICGYGVWERDPQHPFEGETDEEWVTWEHRFGLPWEGHRQQGNGPCLACRGGHVLSPSVLDSVVRLFFTMPKEPLPTPKPPRRERRRRTVYYEQGVGL